MVNERRPVLNSSLFLNAGDEFQGTLFYTYYGGEKIAETINQLGFDGMTLGNHEFDAGDDVLGEFLENLTFPIKSANIQSNHPVLNRTIQPYHIYEEFELAVIGVMTQDTPGISSPGDGTVFTDVVEAVQNTVNLIRETTNVTRIAALTHIGYEEDQALAQNTNGLYLIMGGHSHTPLGDFEDAEGPYPTIAENLDGEEVFIVTAYRWGEYLGYIDVTYDSEGRILEYHGGPIHITNETEQNATLQAQIDEWREPFEAFAAEEIGMSNVVLDQETCQEQECLLGDFMADAMLAYRLNESDSADFAIINAGGIRATIDEGSITRGEVLTLFPFGNSLVEISMSGDDLWNVLEGICTGVSQFNGEEVTSFFQISRIIEVEWNPENSNGTRLVSVTIGNASLDREETYNIVTLDFLAGGGDNFFPTPFEDAITLETQDEILTRYIQSQSPVDIELDRRITIVDAPGGGNGTTSSDATSTDNEADSNITTGDASTSTGGSSDRYLGTKLAFYLPLAAFAVMLVQL
ncbi:5'-nucleotidase [Fulvia fulva]|uniref:5'-nucleotidase n=1 Tax=Passalora fulva TaxID=5499 RepID=A0A9Q8L7P3_PASFU|nr:5'-nucleotidase [Fulvia fulva]KAK4634697.1 5'-nucleotidase [Fulvia fulva]KAK4637600.1 5'-nucleotidase [Fulvia fulva]UJO12426.1 5'-nucleotidase [Fulvia fulva]WPV10203.1 5'-nucleotidase [Fulvia fulva]WPV24155.1 5'-nucleotidase [Fulvia fulva]